MVINITVVLLAHHTMLFADAIFTYDAVNLFKYLPIVLRTFYIVSFGYFATVLMLLFAAETVNLFVKIVLVFSEIDHYVTKATIIAWSKELSCVLLLLLFLFFSNSAVFDWILVQFYVLIYFQLQFNVS